MDINFYNSTNDTHVVNKLLYAPFTVSGNLRDEQSITSPAIEIASDTSILNYNYCYIPDLKRYYFIMAIDSVRTGLWRIFLHVDVLMSFKEQFLPLSAVIARQENLYNLYLADDRFLVNTPRRIYTVPFPNRLPAAADGTKSFVLTIAGGEGSVE